MSTTSAIDTSARPECGKYSKRLCNISKAEAQLLVTHYDNNADLTTLTSRSQLLETLFTAKPEFMIDALDRLFCFDIILDNETHRIRYVNCEHDDLYPERGSTSTIINIEEIIRKVRSALNISQDVQKLDNDSLETHTSVHNYHTPHQPRMSFKFPKPEEKADYTNQDMINSSIVDTLQRISNKLQGSTGSTSKKPFVSKNLHYDDAEDISIFFNKISASAQGQNLKNDSDKINMAVQVLSSSSTGSQLLGLCSEDNYTDWKRFCTKLLRMCGSSHEFYEQQFLAYERLPGQPSSLLMAKLIDLYRRSCEYSETQKLNKFEERHIRMRFLLCLEPELRALLEDRLSNMKPQDMGLETVAEKCQELETYFRLGRNKPKVVNAIKQTQESGFTEQQFKTLLEAIKSINQPKSAKSKQVITDPDLKDFCMRFVKGTCPFGDRCRYKHDSPVPEAVLKHMKQRYKITPKSA